MYGKVINITDKQNVRFPRILLKNFAWQNFGLYARFARFLRRKQIMSPYIFLWDSKLRVKSSAVNISSAWEGTCESNCLSPRTKAPRAQGRARRPIGTHGGRT